MSISLERFCCILQFIMPSQVELYTYIGVAGYGCSISSSVVMTNMASMVLIKRAAHSASESDVITF